MNAANVDEARQLLEARARELRTELGKIEEAIRSLDRSSSGTPSNGSTGRKTRREEALELIARNPGITIKELATSMGLNGPHYLYRVLPGLEREKLISRKGEGYQAKRR